MTVVAAALASRLAAYGLDGEEGLVAEPLALPEWGALTGRAVRERMEGMLAYAVHVGAIRVSDAQMAELTRLARSRARADLRLESETLQASAALEAAGIPFRVLKGPAWAHSAYPDPMMRGFGDVDLLVHGNSWYDAIETLRGHGARRVVPELRPGFDSRFGKEATLVRSSRAEIDLHRTLVVGAYGFWIDCRDLMSRPPGWITLGGTPVPVLDAAASFVHACYNAALTDDPPRLMALRDVAQMAAHADLVPDEVLDLARRWRGESVVRRALDLAGLHLGVRTTDWPLGRCFEGRVPASHRILMASYRGTARGYTSQLTGLAALPGVRTRLAYLGALVRPQRPYLEARGYGRIGYIGHVLRKVWSR